MIDAPRILPYLALLVWFTCLGNIYCCGQGITEFGAAVSEPRIIGKFSCEQGHGRTCISPDGKLILIASMASIEAFRWNESSQEFEQATLEGVLPRTSYFSFARDSKRLLSTTSGGRSVVYDYDGVKLKEIASLPVRTVSKILSISADGNSVAAYDSHENQVRVFDLAAPEPDKPKTLVDTLYKTRIHDLHLSRGGGQLVVAQDTRLVLVDSESGAAIETAPLKKTKSRIEISVDGRYVMLGKSDFVEIATGKSVHSTRAAVAGGVSGDGKHCMVISFQKILQFFSTQDGKKKYEITIPSPSRSLNLTLASKSGIAVIRDDLATTAWVIEFPFQRPKNP